METKSKLMGSMGIAFLLMAMSTPANAVEVENVTITVLENQKIHLDARNPQKQSMNVELINSLSGETIYNSDIPNSVQYHVVYDLSHIPEGGYTLKYTIANRIYEKELLIQESNTTLLAETTYLSPAFRQEAEELFVTVFNPKNEDVTISFWKGSDSFFTDSPEVDGSFKRHYSLSDLEPGEYTVNVSTRKDSYSYPLVVE